MKNNEQMRRGVVEIDGKKIPVDFYFIGEDTIRCFDSLGFSFDIHYKSLVE